jgi:phosphohistidine phosphatase SixA
VSGPRDDPGRAGPHRAREPRHASPAVPRRAALGAVAAAASLLATARLVEAAAPAPAGASGAAPSPELLAVLRDGGCVLVLRHARTDPGVGDPPGFRLDACATQRNLSAEGRAQAERLGAVLRDAGVPIGPVRSSRWCRCLDTARLAFGRVEPWPSLDSFFADRSDARTRTDAVRAWALGFRGPGNAVLVTHQVNASALLGGWIETGEAIVLRARGDALETVGRFGPGA